MPRSFIVAAAHTQQFQPKQVVLANGNLMPIDSFYKPELLAWFRK